MGAGLTTMITMASLGVGCAVGEQILLVLGKTNYAKFLDILGFTCLAGSALSGIITLLLKLNSLPGDTGAVAPGLVKSIIGRIK